MAAPLVEDQSARIAFLLSPRTHGGVAPTRIDTHACVIVLAGDRAYKLKRAVAYSFMDYGSLAKREAATRAELRLNRRTAPDLYLGIQPIVASGAGDLALGPLIDDPDAPAPADADIRDWLVVMRRFRQDALFDAIARAGKLTWPLLEDLTDAAARLHQAAERAPPEAFDAREVARLAAENVELIRAFPDLFPAQAVDRLEKAIARALERAGPAIDARARAGHTRLCHGDLHLRNAVLIDGRATLFDCVEFNPRYATTDTLYDLAYLIMDLDHRGLGAAANRVFNRYLDTTGDRRGLIALPLYLSVRAQIRAKVTAAGAEEAPDMATAQAMRAEARAYFDLARTYLDPAPASLTAIGGLSGSGKSTRARAMARGLGPAPGAVVLRSDRIRKDRFGVSEADRLGPDAYRPAVSIAVYDTLVERAEALLGEGMAVIADATFLHPDSRAAIQAVAARAGVAFDGIWLEAPEARIRARLSARARAGADASDADVAVFDRQLEEDPGPITWRREPG